VGTIGQEWAVTYVSTKGGITAMTKALAVDEGPARGARERGAARAIETRCSAPSLRQGEPQQVQDMLDSYAWLQRVGTRRRWARPACSWLRSGELHHRGEVPVSGGAELA